jgi:hypothetical protein
MQAQAVGVMRSSVGFLGLGKGFPERFMARQGYSGNGGLGARGYGMVSPLVAAKRPRGQALGYSASGSVDDGSVNKVGCQFVKANLATLDETVGRGEEVQEVFLAERIRRALQKLTPEERWLFSTHLREGPFNDMLLSQEQIAAEMKGERAVLALKAGELMGEQIEGGSSGGAQVQGKRRKRMSPAQRRYKEETMRLSSV